MLLYVFIPLIQIISTDINSLTCLKDVEHKHVVHLHDIELLRLPTKLLFHCNLQCHLSAVLQTQGRSAFHINLITQDATTDILEVVTLSRVVWETEKSSI